MGFYTIYIIDTIFKEVHMSNINPKLEQLKNYLGEKKLKQLGLLICNTCHEILTHIPEILPSLDLDSKAYITPEELATIREKISQSASDFIPSTSKPLADTSTVEQTSNDSITLASELLTLPITSEEDLLKRLAMILNESHTPYSDTLGMGYTYNIYPALPPHSLICSECGRQYAIAHPTLNLMPLPVPLTDTEYEMIKGVYVDILL